MNWRVLWFLLTEFLRLSYIQLSRTWGSNQEIFPYCISLNIGRKYVETGEFCGQHLWNNLALFRISYVQLNQRWRPVRKFFTKRCQLCRTLVGHQTNLKSRFSREMFESTFSAKAVHLPSPIPRQRTFAQNLSNNTVDPHIALTRDPPSPIKRSAIPTRS